MSGMTFFILKRKVVWGYNAEKTLRYGLHRDRYFTALGVWPLLIGWERKR